MSLQPSINCVPVYPISNNPDENAIESLPCLFFGDVEQGGDSHLLSSADVISLSDAQIDFNVYSTYKYLAFQIRHLGEFFLISLRVFDTNGVYRNIMISNNRSTVLISRNEVKMPLLVKEGWQFIGINLEDILQRAFSVGYDSCSQLIISGSCRIWRMYFQEKEYADCQLPYFLRVGI